MAVPVGMAFGGTWKHSLLAGVGLGIGLFLLFDKALDVGLPTGVLSAILGGRSWKRSTICSAVLLSHCRLKPIVAALGAFLGTVVGMLPGVGPTNGVAILMPLAFALKLPPETALILLAAVYVGCDYGGRISSILIDVPGDAGAIMATLDGDPMARKGLGGIQFEPSNSMRSLILNFLIALRLQAILRAR